MRRTILSIALATSIIGSAGAHATSPCPDIQAGDEKRDVKVGSSLSLITKLLSSIGLTAEYTTEITSRLPTKADQILQLYQFKVSCELIISAADLTTKEKLQLLREEFQSIFLITKIAPQSRLGVDPNYKTANFLLPMTLNRSGGIYLHVPIWRIAASRDVHLIEDHLPPPPANPPPKGATIIRVFPKKNLDVLGVIKLRRLLPNYDVRLGASQISRSDLADTLFVDRDKVAPEQVIEVLKTLNEMGVPIKSVQQSTFKQPEIQVGTIVSSDGKQVFAETKPLDISELAKLTGAEFWRAAFNGYVSCSGGIGHAYPCRMSSDARPLGRPGP